MVLLIGRMYYLTARQVCERYYSQGSIKYVSEQLRILSEELGYLRSLELRAARRGGSSPKVYTLDRRGRDYCRDYGLAIPKRWRPSEQSDPSPLHMDHTLAVNDVLIMLEQLDTPTLEHFIHERDFKRMNLRCQPDAWVDFTVEREQVPYILEVDRGTEDRHKIEDKVGKIMWFMHSGTYARVTGTDAFGGVIFIASDEKRTKQLTSWIDPFVAPYEAWKGAFRVTDDYRLLPTMV